MDSPQLTEPGVKTFLSQILRKCHVVKDQFYNTLLNLGLLLVFIILVGGILIYNYRGTSPEEQALRSEKRKAAILENIRKYRKYEQQRSQRLAGEGYLNHPLEGGGGYQGSIHIGRTQPQDITYRQSNLLTGLPTFEIF